MKLLFPALPLALLMLTSGCKTAPDKKEEPDAAPASASVPAPAPMQSAVQASPAAASPGAGTVTTSSGLQYRVVASGPAGGQSPGPNSSVRVHYRGMLTDGTVFDSSIDRGSPATFGVSQVIPGWTEALQLMKPGDQWVLYIPARLAYGSRAVGSQIPPNSDLIFQVALLNVF